MFSLTACKTEAEKEYEKAEEAQRQLERQYKKSVSDYNKLQYELNEYERLLDRVNGY